MTKTCDGAVDFDIGHTPDYAICSGEFAFVPNALVDEFYCGRPEIFHAIELLLTAGAALSLVIVCLTIGSVFDVIVKIFRLIVFLVRRLWVMRGDEGSELLSGA